MTRRVGQLYKRLKSAGWLDGGAKGNTRSEIKSSSWLMTGLSWRKGSSRTVFI